MRRRNANRRDACVVLEQRDDLRLRKPAPAPVVLQFSGSRPVAKARGDGRCRRGGITPVGGYLGWPSFLLYFGHQFDASAQASDHLFPFHIDLVHFQVIRQPDSSTGGPVKG